MSENAKGLQSTVRLPYLQVCLSIENISHRAFQMCFYLKHVISFGPLIFLQNQIKDLKKKSKTEKQHTQTHPYAQPLFSKNTPNLQDISD